MRRFGNDDYRYTLLIIEVADSSLDYDRSEKLPRYAQAEIPEVWLVDLANKTVEQYSRPRNSRYADASTFEQGQLIKSKSVEGLSLPVNDILGL